MSENYRRTLGKEDVRFDVNGTGETRIFADGIGGTYTVSSINASQLPMLSTSRAWGADVNTSIVALGDRANSNTSRITINENNIASNTSRITVSENNIASLASGKQDKLVAGDNIIISDNTISSEGELYTSGFGIEINNGTISTNNQLKELTCFEVLANSEVIIAGSTAYNGIDLSYTSGTTIRGTAVEIPVGLTEEFSVWTHDSEVLVEWGDGSTNTYDVVDETATPKPKHTYANKGLYTIKIYTNGLIRLSHTSTNNLLHRVLEDDLPCKALSLQNIANNSLRLVKISRDTSWGFGIGKESWLQAFIGCTNLRSVSGFTRIGPTAVFKSVFEGCSNLEDCDVVLPPLATLSGDNANGYRRVFYGAHKVKINLSKLFTWGGFTQRKVDITGMFSRSDGVSTYDNLTGVPPSNLLWKDTSKTFVGFNIFAQYMSAEIKANFPTGWGGTDSSLVINPDTGTIYTDLIAGDNVILTNNTISAIDTIYDDTSITNLVNQKASNADLALLATTVSNNQNTIASLVSGKQDKLIVGDNISISGNTISAIDTIYDDSTIRTLINAKQDSISVASPLQLSNNTISLDGGSFARRDIYGDYAVILGMDYTPTEPLYTVAVGSWSGFSDYNKNNLLFGGGGVNTFANHCLAFGGSNQITNSYNFLLGYQLQSSGAQFITTIGRSNLQDANAYFIVGNGTSSTVRSNAFVVKKTGDIHVLGGGTFGGDVWANGIKLGGGGTGGSYVAGANITINDNTISATDTTYVAGANIIINDNTISALGGGTGGSYVAGDNISINGNTISATDTTYVAGDGITIEDNAIKIDGLYLEVGREEGHYNWYGFGGGTYGLILWEGFQFNCCNITSDNGSIDLSDGNLYLRRVSSERGTLVFENNDDHITRIESFGYGDIQRRLTAGYNITINDNTIGMSPSWTPENIDITHGSISLTSGSLFYGNGFNFTRIDSIGTLSYVNDTYINSTVGIGDSTIGLSGNTIGLSGGTLTLNKTMLDVKLEETYETSSGGTETRLVDALYAGTYSSAGYPSRPKLCSDVTVDFNMPVHFNELIYANHGIYIHDHGLHVGPLVNNFLCNITLESPPPGSALLVMSGTNSDGSWGTASYNYGDIQHTLTQGDNVNIAGNTISIDSLTGGTSGTQWTVATLLQKVEELEQRIAQLEGN